MDKVFNPGDLRDKIEIMEIQHLQNNYSWKPVTTAWAQAEQTIKNNIYSNLGYGARQINFLIRKQVLTLHKAILWKGKHCFLTDIKEIDRAYFEVTAALIEPIMCSVERTDKPILDGLNRPIYVDSNPIYFPACITEKYIRQTQENPMSTIESSYVLVTPKVVELIDGELVTINNIAYEVLVSHTLDDYKNEYEIRVRSES